MFCRATSSMFSEKSSPVIFPAGPAARACSIVSIPVPQQTSRPVPPFGNSARFTASLRQDLSIPKVISVFIKS